MSDALMPSRHVGKRGNCLICGCSTTHDGFLSCRGHTPDEVPPVDQGITDNEREALISLGKLRKQLKAMVGPRRNRRGSRKRLPRCPDCNRHPCEYLEVWAGHTISFLANGGVPDHEGNMEDGSPTHVQASCVCGKKWRLKGVLQITDLEGLTP
jgi:hypothetical protein